MPSPTKVAIDTELDPLLADTIHDRLSSWRYQVGTFATHRAAASAAELVDHVDVLAASVPASDEDRPGSYLEEVATRQGPTDGGRALGDDGAQDIAPPNSGTFHRGEIRERAREAGVDLHQTGGGHQDARGVHAACVVAKGHPFCNGHADGDAQADPDGMAGWTCNVDGPNVVASPTLLAAVEVS